MKEKILLFSCDPGGSNTIIPLVQPLIQCGYEVKLYGKDSALLKYQQNGLIGIDISSICKTINPISIKKLLKQEKPNLIITGTSSNDFTEKFMWRVGKKVSIPSFAILDQWTNYGIRFSSYPVSQIDMYERNPNRDCLPTKICVMDNYAKNKLLNLDFNKKDIIVTGHPFFSLTRNKRSEMTNDQIQAFRKERDVRDTDFLITYVSEPLTETYSSCNKIGYTELTIFEEIIKALLKISLYTRRKIVLIIKIHPREYMDKYKTYIRKINTGNIDIRIDKNSHPWELVLSSQLVCGMSSILLIESVILRVPILSIQIGLRGKNSFILSEQKLTRTILSQHSLMKVFKSAIIDTVFPKSRFPFIDDSVSRIISQIKEQLYGSSCN